MTDSMSDQIKVREISPFFIIWIFINKNCFMKQIFEILQEERDRILDIHESATKNQYLNTLIVEEKEAQILTEGEYITKQFNTFGTTLKNGVAAIAKGVKFEPSKKLVGYLIANPKTIYRGNGVGNWDKDPGETVQYNCSAGKFRIGKGEMGLYNTTLSKALGALCSESMSKNIVQPKKDDQANKPDASQQKTPEKVYTMVRGKYNVNSDDGKTYTIPDGTRYVYNADKKGATFRLDTNKWGWFGCQSKIFVIDSVKYKDTKGYLVNNIVNNICEKASDDNGSRRVDSNVGGKVGGATVAKPNDTALDTILQKISGATTQKPGEVKQAPQTWEG